MFELFAPFRGDQWQVLTAVMCLNPDTWHFGNDFTVAIGSYPSARAVAQSLGASHGASHAG